MSWYRSNGNSDAHGGGIRNPYLDGPSKRQRILENDGQSANDINHHHNRCVLLFDMDCFYAQCERVRLGLPLDVKLCLFQWNSVLAVTYPAREHGIKRGDSWDDVAAKTKPNSSPEAVTTTASSSNKSGSSGNHTTSKDDNGCYTIHLPIIGHDTDASRAETKNHDTHDGEETETTVVDDDDDESIEASYRRIFDLSKEEQLRCRRTENGVRKFHQQGKACLERYRLASMRIFAVVLESLQKRVTHQCGYSFVLERASIDEFYLDLTDYCYQRNRHKDFVEAQGQQISIDEEHDSTEKTVIAGRKQLRWKQKPSDTHPDGPIKIALNRACRVSHWIRQDIWKILGFTMSAGISTNKTMAKLAASYGKPNGQAVLYPNYFPNVLAETKITKVRNFGGKLGKTVLQLLLQHQRKEHPENKPDETDVEGLERLKSTATMGDLNQIPLPFLLHSKLLSNESARFVFSASQGIDHEEVKETSGALVKSITAFKSFTATKSHSEIFDRWLSLLANEIVERVARDTARNKRYPKSCTLNYSYYTTWNGQRPSVGSRRSKFQSKSLRLHYPSEREGTKQQKSATLLTQAKAKLIPIVKDQPLRGVGLSVSNFIESCKAVHKAPEGTASIQSFFAASKNPVSKSSSVCSAERGRTQHREEEVLVDTAMAPSAHSGGTKPQMVPLLSSSTTNSTSSSVFMAVGTTNRLEYSETSNPASGRRICETAKEKKAMTLEDRDLDYARKLQASFDRENYALSTANRRQKSVSNRKKTKRIDTFFKKR